MGIAVYELGSSMCEIHHIRNPWDDKLNYEPRTQPLKNPVLRDRCELNSFTSERKDEIVQLLSTFGNHQANILEFGMGNCQDWTVAAVLVLEHAGFVDEGEGDFWRGMINLSARQIQDHCVETGRNSIAGPEAVFEGEPDARFKDKVDVRKPVEKLNKNTAFQERIQSILGNTQHGQHGGAGGRPFYLSIPFWSQTRRET